MLPFYRERRTILHIAVSHGRSEILAYLIENFQDKLDFDAVDADGVSIANELEGVLVYGKCNQLRRSA